MCWDNLCYIQMVDGLTVSFLRFVGPVKLYFTRAAF